LLTLQLLRVRTRNGAIFPLFSGKDEDIELSKKIIQEFEFVRRNKEKKSELEDRIAAIEESETVNDYKLVRGFYSLLERRCTFKTKDSTTEIDGTSSSSISIVDPPLIRRAIFEESSRRGFALTELERREIADSVAAKLHLSSYDAVLKAIWSDLDDNLILDHFQTLDPEALVGWYNLSLMQTLLFNCTKLDFYISGGLNWKRVLRSVKRLGLMYHLQQPQQQGKGGEYDRIICSVEGPLSLFKLTDRYGTLLAKLLPSIIFTSNKKMEKRSSNGIDENGGEWQLDAWIIRKTMDGRKMYEFKISNKEIPKLLAEPYPFPPSSPTTRQENYSSFPYNNYEFDSSVEEKFANRFEQAETGWKMTREPDPLVLSNGGAFIPDFMFEKYDTRIYLEIVGFWTKEYLERKLQKLADIFVSADNRSKNANQSKAEILFIAVNEDLACSKASLSLIIPTDHLIFYKNDVVPVKPILDYLKSIDKEMIDIKVNDPNLKIILDDDDNNTILSIKDIAQKYDVSTEVARRISLRDNDEKFIEAGMYLIPKSKTHRLESLLDGIIGFGDACSVLAKEGIPEPCHAELIIKLGYEVIWQSIDASTAGIRKKI
jgi:uncharacterized protein